MIVEENKYNTLPFKFKVLTKEQAIELAQAVYAVYNEKVNLWNGTYGQVYFELPKEFYESTESFFEEC